MPRLSNENIIESYLILYFFKDSYDRVQFIQVCCLNFFKENKIIHSFYVISKRSHIFVSFLYIFPEKLYFQYRNKVSILPYHEISFRK